MTRKEELQAKAEELGLDFNDSNTIAELEGMIAEKEGDQGDSSKAEGEAELTQRRVSRGSRRRVTRALERFNDDIDHFIKEMDMQFYLTEDGERVGECELVEAARAVKTEFGQEVEKMLSMNGDKA